MDQNEFNILQHLCLFWAAAQLLPTLIVKYPQKKPMDLCEEALDLTLHLWKKLEEKHSRS